jgi:hypothetical protein
VLLHVDFWASTVLISGFFSWFWVSGNFCYQGPPAAAAASSDIDDLDLNGYSKTHLRSISGLLLYKRGNNQMTKGKDDDGSNGSPCHGSKDWTKAAMLRSSSNGWFISVWR